MSVLRRILGNERSEVYVSFMYEWINRFKESEEFPPHLDSLFGTAHWRDALRINDPGDRRRFLFSVYEQQLREAGATQIVRFDLYHGNRLKYAIFFATHSTTGSDRMKEAIWKVAPFGDFAFRGSRSSQFGLDLHAGNFSPLRDVLRTEFAGSDWVPIERVRDFVASDRTDYFAGQMRKRALVPMENSGGLEVDPSTRTRRRTYPAGTMLRFRTS